MEMALFKRIVEQLARYDDVKITFGGYGEPLLHPELPEMIAHAREAGIFGIHVSTNGLLLEGRLAEQLVQLDVDVVSISVDGVDEESYATLKGKHRFQQVMSNVKQFLQLRRKKAKQWPLLVLELLKVRETEAGWEIFYDRWARTVLDEERELKGQLPKEEKADVVLPRGFNDFAGQREDMSLLHLLPARRIPCLRLQNQMFVFSDGKVPMCGQDYQGRFVVGDLNNSTVEELWQGAELLRLRELHYQGRYDEHPLCARCRFWHQPG
jgi:radical SAM protein with 4Fe4S-binding SPASM domain